MPILYKQSCNVTYLKTNVITNFLLFKWLVFSFFLHIFMFFFLVVFFKISRYHHFNQEAPSLSNQFSTNIFPYLCKRLNNKYIRRRRYRSSGNIIATVTVRFMGAINLLTRERSRQSREIQILHGFRCYFRYYSIIVMSPELYSVHFLKILPEGSRHS